MIVSELEFSESLTDYVTSNKIMGGVFAYASANTYAGRNVGYASGEAFASGKTTSTYAKVSVKKYNSVTDVFSTASAYARQDNNTSRASATSLSLYVYN